VENVDIFQKLKQVEDNAWMLFNELPPCGARTRALHVFLDAKDLKAIGVASNIVTVPFHINGAPA